MSIQAISDALKIQGVTPSEKLLLIALANYADEDGRCWPSQSTLADDTCLTDRTIRTLLKSLEASNFLSREDRFRKDGTRTSDAFHLNFEVWKTAHKRKFPVDEPAEIDVGIQRKSTAHPPEIISGLTTFEPFTTEPSVGTVRACASKNPKKGSSKFTPTGWIPSEDDRQVGRDAGLSEDEIDRQLAMMRDHEYPSPKSDWSRAFRNWLRRTKPNHPIGGLFNARSTPVSPKFDAHQANLDRAYAGAESAARRRAFEQDGGF